MFACGIMFSRKRDDRASSLDGQRQSAFSLNRFLSSFLLNFKRNFMLVIMPRLAWEACGGQRSFVLRLRAIRKFSKRGAFAVKGSGRIAQL